MSDDDHTHRVVGESHYRTTENDASGGSYATYEVGDPITPTEGELSAAPERFEPLDDAADEQGGDEDEAESGDSGGVSESESDETEGTDESENDEQADESGESAELTAEDVENADYNELRTMAGEFEDVNGNWGGDRLRAELLDRVGE